MSLGRHRITTRVIVQMVRPYSGWSGRKSRRGGLRGVAGVEVDLRGALDGSPGPCGPFRRWPRSFVRPSRTWKSAAQVVDRWFVSSSCTIRVSWRPPPVSSVRTTDVPVGDLVPGRSVELGERG
jgi:hypothetical protein